MSQPLYSPPYASVAQYFDTKDVHESERIDAGDEILAILVSLIWTFLHGINVYWVFWSELPLVYGVAIHLLLSFVLLVVSLVLKSLGRDIRHLYVLNVASFGASIFGAFGSLMASLLTLIYRRFSVPFAQWYEAIYPDFSFTREEALYEQIITGKDEHRRMYNVVSFADVIALGSEQQKRRALSRMTDHFHPSFAPAYHRALKDESNTVRVLAASCISKVEQQFTKTLMQIERLEQRKPDDMQLKLGLARYYDSYAFTGLLDADREEENRLAALEKYKAYLDETPDDVDVRIEVGRLLLRSGDYDQVIHLLTQCADAGHDTERLRLWMAEALYEAGHYEQLRRIAPDCTALVEPLKDSRPRLWRAIHFWAGGEHAVTT